MMWKFRSKQDNNRPTMKVFLLYNDHRNKMQQFRKPTIDN